MSKKMRQQLERKSSSKVFINYKEKNINQGINLQFWNGIGTKWVVKKLIPVRIRHCNGLLRGHLCLYSISSWLTPPANFSERFKNKCFSQFLRVRAKFANNASPVVLAPGLFVKSITIASVCYDILCEIPRVNTELRSTNKLKFSKYI